MDRYIVRNPMPSASYSPSKSRSSKLKQTTIESLKGVVVVDHILHHKSCLKSSSASKVEKLESLKELVKKIPPRHVMMNTKIGKVINKLRNNEDEDIKKAAKQVYVKWKNHFIEHMERPLIDVKCDLKTEKIRLSGRKLLAESLSVENFDKLPELIERESFQQHKQLITNGYKRTMRHLVFTLRNQEDVKNKVKSGQITVSQFVKEYIKK